MQRARHFVDNSSCSVEKTLTFFGSSANAAPAFEGRGGEDLAIEISYLLSKAYNHRNTLNLSKLCVAVGQHCWILYIDIMVSLQLASELIYLVSVIKEPSFLAPRMRW